MRNLLAILSQEARAIHPRLILAKCLMLPLPPFVGSTLRTRILRLVGFQIGAKTAFWGMPTIVGSDRIYQKLVIGSNCWIGIQTYFDLADHITIGDRTVFGPQVMMITGTHEIGPSSMRVGKIVPKPVCIGSGVWLGARCTVLPGVTIGNGAVVGAGAVVTRDVEPDTLVAGVPAVFKRKLDGEDREKAQNLWQAVSQ